MILSHPGFIIFHVLFFAMMWLSKAAQILYFEEQGALNNFGLSYSAMALVGYLAFFTGHIADRWGHRKVLVLGGFVYGVGLLLRVYPNTTWIAILSGVCAGVGASACLCALRIWMMNLADGSTTERLLGAKSSSQALGMAMGSLGVAAIPLEGASGIFIDLKDLLLVSGMGVLVLTGFYFLATYQTKQDSFSISRILQGFSDLKNAPHLSSTSAPWSSLRLLLGEHKKLAMTTSVVGLCTGLYASFLAPYLPLILKDKGFTLTSIGFSTAALAFLRFAVDPFVARFMARYRDQGVLIFVASEIGIALVTASFLFAVSPQTLVLFLFLRGLCLSFSSLSEELLWFRIFPKASLGLFFGVNQSAYFVGDFLGGIINGEIYMKFGLESSVVFVLAIMIVNSILFLRLLKIRNSVGSASPILGEASC